MSQWVMSIVSEILKVDEINFFEFEAVPSFLSTFANARGWYRFCQFFYDVSTVKDYALEHKIASDPLDRSIASAK